jgi:3-oxoacyl-[acyl-carrier-protein] synthase II
VKQENVVITGLGTINVLGHDTEAFTHALRQGVCGIAPLTLFDASQYRTHMAAEIKGLDPAAMVPPPFSRKRMSRADIMAFASVREALQSAGLLPFPPEMADRTGIISGVGSGGKFEAEQVFESYLKHGRRKVHFSRLSPLCPASSTDRMATAWGFTGPKATFMTACSSGATAIGFARDLIINQMADIVIAGGVEALSRTTYATFNALQAVSPEYCRPFDAKREGLSIGEAAAFLVLESQTHALARGAFIHGEVLGYGVTCDSFHMTAPDPEASGAIRAIRAAIADADISTDDIDYICAHGTATPTNDIMETKAIKEVFGRKSYQIPVSSIKSMTGHTLGASGALAAVASLIAIRERFIPPTIHHDTPDPACDLDYVSEGARPATLNRILINAFAFGGNNTSLILGRYPSPGKEKFP